MANHPSAAKRHRQSLKRRTRNRETKAALKTAAKRVLDAVEAKDLAEAKKQARSTTKLVDKAAVHGVLHKNTARRKISRMAKRLNAAG